MPNIATKRIRLEFGDVEIGTASRPKVIGIQNELSEAVTLREVKLEGLYKHAFQVSTGSTTYPRNFLPGDATSFQVAFAPPLIVSQGEKSAYARVYTTDDQIWLEAQLVGQAVSSGLLPDLVVVITEDDVLPSGVINPDGTCNTLIDRFGTVITDEVGILPHSQWRTYNTPPRLQAEGNADLWELRHMIYSLLSLVSPDLHFAPAYPDLIIGNSSYKYSKPGYVPDRPVDQFQDTITWKVIRREPGTLDGPAFSARKEVKPRTRDSNLRHPTSRNKLVDVMGQWFDNIVQFDCWAKTNTEAEALVEWFEDFMLLYTGHFMRFGISKMHYWRRFEDQEVLKWANPLHVRSVAYYVRTEKLHEVVKSRMRQITIRLMETVDRVPEAEEYATGALQDRLLGTRD